MMTVLNGKRSVAFLLQGTVKEYYKYIENSSAELMVVPRDGVGMYGDGYIIYTDKTKANHLYQVMAKHEGYLQDNTPEEAIENGEALEYDDNDIKEFTDSHYGVGSYDKIKMKY